MSDFKKRNAEFKKANKARRRVMVAKDVLEWIRLGKLISVPGTYLRRNQFSYFRFDNTDARTEVVVNTPSCEVCGMGAIFYGCLDRLNSIKLSEMQPSDPNSPLFAQGGFEPDQLKLIEIWFEGWWREASARGFTMSRSWNKLSPKDRLIEIMNNIISHRGTFVPDDLTV